MSYSPKIPHELQPMTLAERRYPIIDVHGHYGVLARLSTGEPGKMPPISKLQLALEEYYSHKKVTMEEYLATLPTEEEMVALLKKYGVHACPVTWQAPSGQGEIGHDNDYIEALVKRHPDVFLGCGVVLTLIGE